MTEERKELIRKRCQDVTGVEEWGIAHYREDYGQGYGETTFYVRIGERLIKIGTASERDVLLEYANLTCFISWSRDDIHDLLEYVDELESKLKDASGAAE